MKVFYVYLLILEIFDTHLQLGDTCLITPTQPRHISCKSWPQGVAPDEFSFVNWNGKLC